MPAGLKAARLVVIGVGKVAELTPKDFLRLGGLAMGKLPNFDRRRQYLRRTAGRRDESRSRRRIWRKGRACARTHSIATRPSARTTKSRPLFANVTIAVGDVAAVRKADDPRVGDFRRRRYWRAIWSTNRPMSFTRKNSHAAQGH